MKNTPKTPYRPIGLFLKNLKTQDQYKNKDTFEIILMLSKHITNADLKTANKDRDFSQIFKDELINRNNMINVNESLEKYLINCSNKESYKRYINDYLDNRFKKTKVPQDATSRNLIAIKKSMKMAMRFSANGKHQKVLAFHRILLDIASEIYKEKQMDLLGLDVNQ